jgi:hypothetical protein
MVTGPPPAAALERAAAAAALIGFEVRPVADAAEAAIG